MNKRQKELARKLLNHKRQRVFTITETRAAGSDKKEKASRIRFSASSTQPVLAFVETEDFFGLGYEVLSHKAEEMDIARLREGGHFLLDHNQMGIDNNLGRIRDAELDGERLNVEVEFNPHNPAAERVRDEILSDFRPNVSIGYQRKDETGRAIGVRDGKPVVEYDSELYEVSSVLIPADMSVGVGRDAEDFIYREFNLDRDKKTHQALAERLLKEYDVSDEEVDIDEILDELDEEERSEGKRPFAGYADFDDCVSKNQDKKNPEAYCGAIQAQAEKGLEDDEKQKSLIVIDDEQSRSAEDEPEADSKLTEEQTRMSERNDKTAPETSVSVGTDLAAERARVNEINRLGREDNQFELTVKAINEGWDVNRFKAELHDVAKTGRKVDIVDQPNIDDQQSRELDLRQAVYSWIKDKDSSPVDELGREIAKDRGIATKRDALYIPIYVPMANARSWQSRVLQTSPAAQGGALVGTEFYPLAPALFDGQATNRVGVQFHDVRNQVQVPRWLTNMPAGFVGEGSTITPDSGSFSTDTATPHQVVAAVGITPHLGMALDGTYSPVDAVLANMVRSIRTVAERSFWSGSAAAEPGGLVNNANITLGAAASGNLDAYLELWSDLKAVADTIPAAPFVVSPDVFAYGVQTPGLTGGSDVATITTMGAGAYDGMTGLGPVVVSGHLPNQTICGGDWSQALYFTFGVIEMRTSDVQILSGNDLLIARMFVDNVLQEPRSLAAITGSVSI